MKENEKRRVTVTLTPNQFRELEMLMEEDGQTNFTAYFMFLVMQEKKNRKGIATKRPVGRPPKARRNPIIINTQRRTKEEEYTQRRIGSRITNCVI